MKRRLFLLSILASLSLCGCDALDAFFDEKPAAPDESQEQTPKDQTQPSDDGKQDPAALKSISIEGSLTKTQYYIDQDWSSEGLSVKGYYSNDNEKTLDSSDYEFTFAPAKPALDVTKIKVTAKTKVGDLSSASKEYCVEVFERIPSDKVITSIAIEETLTKTEYIENDEWDPTGLKVKANFNDTTSSYLSNEDYVFIYNPTKAFKGTASVNIKARLSDGSKESETRSFAVQVKTQYTVSFDGNGSTSGSMNEIKTTESSYTAPTCLFKKSGYKFDGWALNSPTGTKYAIGNSITLSSNITLYATWIVDSSTDDFDGYYSSIDEDSSTLLADLRELNLSKRNTTFGYSSLNSYFKYTDYDPAYVQYDENNQPYSNRLLSFYSGISTTSYNKEHVWPNSRGGGKEKGKSGAPYVEDDIYMPRPTITEENSDRGNSSYVEGMAHSSNGWDPVYAFENNIGVYESIRGECARIIFYCMTVNENLKLVDDANIDFANTGGRVTMGKLSDMIKWNEQNPVNEREIRRQSGGQYLQGNRNAFVDHPEYVCKIWGNTNDATRKACGLA